MKILAALGLVADLLVTQINAQPHSTTTSFLAHSSKSIKAVATATPDFSFPSVLPAASHTVTAPSAKPHSVDSTFLTHEKSIHSLPATFVPHLVSDDIINSQAEPLAKRLEGDDGPYKQGSEDEGRPKDPEDEKDHPGLSKRALSGKKSAGGFLKTCAPNWVVWELNNAIWANCRGSGERRGSVYWTRIGLDHMLGNERGLLVYRRDGGFSSTCVDCKRWGTAHLACRCLDGRGDFQATSINLDKYIGNYDALLCSEYECGAREAPPPDAN
ncbi:hypothetical protein LZ30DRAFT_777425 [Colletotrichum cereale]|nr:hypothetical protein LZ30DRAFT_777425 [Colletotrichum cereale]